MNNLENQQDRVKITQNFDLKNIESVKPVDPKSFQNGSMDMKREFKMIGNSTPVQAKRRFTVDGQATMPKLKARDEKVGRISRISKPILQSNRKTEPNSRQTSIQKVSGFM